MFNVVYYFQKRTGKRPPPGLERLSQGHKKHHLTSKLYSQAHKNSLDFVIICWTMNLATILLLVALSIRSIDAFVGTPWSTSKVGTKLLAKKKTNKKKSSSGGGFGSSSSGSAGAKTRTVSGYTGSGTKPLRNAANTFDAIRKVYGKDGTSDLYMRSPLNNEELFWFVGKVCRRLDMEDEDFCGTSLPTEMEAVISQKRLIIEYAKNQLRPQNFGGPYSKNLEIWIAPGDSEMDIVQNKMPLVKVTGSQKDLSETFSVKDVGFNPEIYLSDEQREGGLRVKRDEFGEPLKDVFEINA